MFVFCIREIDDDDDGGDDDNAVLVMLGIVCYSGTSERVLRVGMGEG